MLKICFMGCFFFSFFFFTQIECNMWAFFFFFFTWMHLKVWSVWRNHKPALFLCNLFTSAEGLLHLYSVAAVIQGTLLFCKYAQICNIMCLHLFQKMSCKMHKLCDALVLYLARTRAGVRAIHIYLYICKNNKTKINPTDWTAVFLLSFQYKKASRQLDATHICNRVYEQWYCGIQQWEESAFSPFPHTSLIPRSPQVFWAVLHL